MTWNALDFRSKDLTKEQIDALVLHLNTNEVWDGKKLCCLYHTIPGNAAHMHVQSDKGETQSGAV